MSSARWQCKHRDGLSAGNWLEKAICELSHRDNVTVLPRTTAFGYYNHNHVGMVERISDHLTDVESGIPRERLWQICAKEVDAGNRRP